MGLCGIAWITAVSGRKVDDGIRGDEVRYLLRRIALTYYERSPAISCNI